MANKTSKFGFKNYLIINGGDPIPQEKLAPEEHKTALLHMLDAAMKAQGYERIKEPNPEPLHDYQ